MVKQFTGRMLILGAKQGCIGCLLRLRIKLKHLSIQFRKSEIKCDKGRAWEAAASYSTDDQNTTVCSQLRSPKEREKYQNE